MGYLINRLWFIAMLLIMAITPVSSFANPVSFKDGWALARSSNTQPVLVLRYEASTPEGMQRIQNSFEKVVNQYL